jgi:hypothetical protein
MELLIESFEKSKTLLLEIEQIKNNR